MRIWWDLKEVYPKAMRKFQKLLEEDEEDDEVFSYKDRISGEKSKSQTRKMITMSLLMKETSHSQEKNRVQTPKPMMETINLLGLLILKNLVKPTYNED